MADVANDRECQPLAHRGTNRKDARGLAMSGFRLSTTGKHATGLRPASRKPASAPLPRGVLTDHMATIDIDDLTGQVAVG